MITFDFAYSLLNDRKPCPKRHASLAGSHALIKDNGRSREPKLENCIQGLIDRRHHLTSCIMWMNAVEFTTSL
jgi:hypothetical protein